MSPYIGLVLTLCVLYAVYCRAVDDQRAWRLIEGVVVPKAFIVTRTLTVRSLVDCSTKCAKDPSLVSFYFEKTTQLCYCNHDLDINPIVLPAGAIVYGYPAMAETFDDVEKNGKLTSTEACLELLHTTNISFFDDFPNLIPGFSIYTYCHYLLFHDGIVFQRRQDGSVNFTRLWLDYVTGFGNSFGEIWLGLEKIHQITKNKTCELNITMEAEPDHPVLSFGYAHYDRFNISGADDNYRLYVAGFSGTVGNSFSYHSGFQFSTIDADHDAHNTWNCADLFKGGWWYGDCHQSNLNGFFLNGNHASYADGIDWRLPWGYYYSLIKVEMKVRCLFDHV